MPIYEYACQKCGHTLDALQKVSEGPLKKCPDCGALKLRRLVSAPQFRLKGSGWYETDFKKDKQKRLVGQGDDQPASSSDAKPAENSGGKPDGKSDGKDAKPAAAETAKAKPEPVGKARKSTKKAGKSAPPRAARD